MNTRKLWIVAGIAAVVVVVALALALRRQSEVPEGIARWAAAPADTQWVTIDGIEFPTGMETAPPEVVEAYVFAAKHPEVLEYMPCYCGCEHPRVAHENNYDCFIDGIDHSRDVPRVQPDAMGFS